jgi:acyl-CoA synthetase (AMP-forming)/AMP-acid ligase II
MMEGEVDLSSFPLFALFAVAIGMTSVIPDIDFTRPARVDPARMVDALERYRVVQSFGSPAFWDRVGKYAFDRGVRLPSLRRVLIAGAPVPAALLRTMDAVLPEEAECHTPYGATEALPLASIEKEEVLPETAQRTRNGAGICVGCPLPGIEVRVISISDEPIPEWPKADVLPCGQIGEIVVKGPVVTREYCARPEATVAAKIWEGDAVRHRMGDVGYLDERGRLWFCGRKSHRVETSSGRMFTIPCEAIFNEHPRVSRSALVGVGPAGRQRPVIVIEPRKGQMPRTPWSRRRFARELRLLGAAREHTRGISDFFFHPSFPVDVRHNAKVFREKLAVWTQRRV